MSMSLRQFKDSLIIYASLANYLDIPLAVKMPEKVAELAALLVSEKGRTTHD